mgnify:CR=1 FL=1
MGCSGCALSRTAHPRGGGENIITGVVGVLSEGSSPRGRGKRPSELFEVTVEGLIPAGAGKTRAVRPTWIARSAHPRGGGENGPRMTTNVDTRGSSPRGRGKQNGGEHVAS